MALEARMNRLFGADGRCFQVAMDHALFNGYQLLNGVRDFDAVLKRITACPVDALLLSPGHADRLQKLKTTRKPALVMRADVANVYDAPRPDHGFSILIGEPVETALRLDAAAVVLNLFLVMGSPAVHEQCLRNLTRVKQQAWRYDLPVMVEPLVLVPDETVGAYQLSGRAEWLIPLHRQAVELGADILKSDPTDSVENYAELVEVVGGVPLLPRGGGRVAARGILERTWQMIQAGASGVVYGRNVFQHPDVEGMTRALHGVVHDGLGVEEALAIME